MNRNIKFRIYDDVHKIMVFIDEVFKMCFDDKHFESYELMFDENKCLICRGFDTIDSDFGDEMLMQLKILILSKLSFIKVNLWLMKK